MKYIIEIEDDPFGRNDDPNIPHGMDELYRAKGFNTLVFDKYGLDKLTPLNKVLEEAYKNGLHAGESKCEYCVEYKRGLDDAWKAIMKIAKMPDGERMTHFGEVWISKILNTYSLEQIFIILEKSEFKQDEIKVGDEFVNESGKRFVVIKTSNDDIDRYIDENGATYAMTAKYRVIKKTGRHFPQVTELLNAMKGKNGKRCSNCKHFEKCGSEFPCSHCFDPAYSEWELKEGAE